MNRTIKDATVKRFYYDSHDQLRRHLADFVAAYNFGRRLKTLKGLTPYEFICQQWTKEPANFRLNPLQRRGANSASGPSSKHCSPQTAEPQHIRPVVLRERSIATKAIQQFGQAPITGPESRGNLEDMMANRKKTKSEEQKALQLAETTDVSPEQAKDLMRKHGKDSPKVEEEAKNFKAEG
jgi:hypothetical protein